MKKSIITILAVLMLLSIVGCGKKEELNLNVNDIFNAIVDAQPSAVKDSLRFYEETLESAANYYQGLDEYELNQGVYRFAVVTGNSTEIVIVEAKNSSDVDAIIKIFENRIKDASDNRGYADIAKNWQMYAKIQHKGNYIAMICLPGECYVPEDIFDLDSYEKPAETQSEGDAQAETESQSEAELESQSEATGQSDTSALVDMSGHEKFADIVNGLSDDVAVAFIEAYEKDYLLVASTPYIDEDGKLLAPSCEIFGENSSGEVVSFGKYGKDDSTYPIRTSWGFLCFKWDGCIEERIVNVDTTEYELYEKCELTDEGKYHLVSYVDGIDDEFDDESFMNSMNEVYESDDVVCFAKVR